MSITKDAKNKVIEGYKLSDKDTGSPEFQGALLTERINNLCAHFDKHP
jgi:small subunit ribosomal protein S15